MASVKFTIPAQQVDRLLDFRAALRSVFPDRSADLRELFRSAKRGIQCDLQPLRLNQTDEQRGYYWMWLKNFAAFCGNTPDEMHHHVLCEAYGSEYKRTPLGIMQRPLKRSSVAKRDEYSHLIETLIRVASALDFVVPPPVRREG